MSLIGTGFPFRKGDNFQRYMKMFEKVMQSCAGLRRPGAAALDLCYVAAGWYDGFFETGLHPWDMAAGSLMITEAGGLVGNFTGEADFLYQREVVAGNPKVYGQLVQHAGALHASHQGRNRGSRFRGRGRGRDRCHAGFRRCRCGRAGAREEEDRANPQGRAAQGRRRADVSGAVAR